MPDASRPSSADRRLAALFPDDAGTGILQPWWRRRRTFVVAAVVIALSASGLAAANAFGSSGDSYRSATANTETVDAVQTGVATIEPVAQASVAFPVSGTIASVNVQVGQPVAASGTLASLDTQSLMQTLHTRQASLAQAQLTLSKALSGQSVGGIGSGGSGTGTGTGSGATGPGGTGGSTGAAATAAAAYRGGGGSVPSRIVLAAAATNPKLVADQQAVLAAQQHVDQALAAAATALSAESSVCASFTAPPPASTTTPATTTTAPPDVTGCQQGIAAVVNAQGAVDAAQKTLATASSTLDALVEQLAATPPSTQPATTPSAPSAPSTPTNHSGSAGAGNAAGTGSSSIGFGGSGSSRSGGSVASSSPSAADLVAYQRSVDAALAAMAVAQQALDQATISSPLAGTVVAVNMKVGDTVGADSSTENVVVQGAGGYEVTTTISVDDIPSVSVGQVATVVPDGTRDALPGKVVAISVVPASTSTTSTLYRVTIGLDDPTRKLNNGATGTVSIMTKQVRAALAVPTSAVTTTRNRHFVSVLSGGTVNLVPVQVGVVGSTWSEITGGLRQGQQVVLADESAALPSSATASATSTSGTSPFGRFGGVGGFGGPGGGTGRAGSRGG